ncbi:uncharacterized protein LOC129765796 [Toxorhynchites rutilus septentrionalis]|uniref:uncharacterized protein LOC129765796 n=1 Tax=Toxorhynchites rutilus septentrionalis TaxID=329112 RepID=UPI002479357B|nr:uncharacterized protein LOC129765796 [Toxorhynchites rutilus septentrionalis]
MTFVGYSSQQKAYRFLDLMTGTIVNRRDARFLTMGNTGQDEASENGSIIECSIGEHAFPKTNNFPIVAGDVHSEQPEIEEESDSDEEDDQNETIDPYVDCDATLTDGNDEDERPPNAPIAPKI